MSSNRSRALMLVTLALVVLAGSLPAENPKGEPVTVPSTTADGAMPPVKEFNVTPIDVIGTAPMAPPPMVETKPYTEKAPVDPEAVDAKIEGDDQTESMSGVSKITLYLDKEPPLSRVVGADGGVIPSDEMLSTGESSRALANPYFVSTGQINEPIPDGGWLWWRAIDSTQAPVGAVVTNLEYRMWMGNPGDPGSFYCADYEIHLFTGLAARELMIYDNLGGRTDGGFDDDVEDDGDIYLNGRTTHFFDGNDARDWFGIWIDDLYTPDFGQLNYIDFWVHWEVPLPNLRCYQPAGWDSAIVASSVTGTHTADSLTGDEPAYIDWSVINDGGADVAGRFYTALYIDGNYITQWFTDDLGMNWWAWVADYAQTLPAGDHEICIVADHTGLIAEENENDNTCCFTYHWYPAYVPPDLHCYSPGWDGPIVASAVRGTSTQDTIRLCDTAFIDWAVGNSGGAPTADRYYVRLLVDGVVAAAWFKDPPHDNGFYIWVTDHPLFFATAGTHILSLEIDYTDAIVEGNENNNSCEVATIVIECLDPDVACYAPDGWDAPIIVSGVAGTTTQGPVTVGQTAYIDFALANIGTAATTVNIYHTLYIDGDSTMTWFSTPINPGDYRWVADYPFTFATPGNHTVRLFHDATDAVSEPDEVNNICEYVVDVQPARVIIAGQVHDPGGVGIPDVTMTFTGVGAVSTDGNGFYEQAVPVGWSGRVTPSKACLEFLPPYRDYVNVTTNLTNQNYEGSFQEYEINGYVRDGDNVGIPGVEMAGLPGSPVTEPTGFYAALVPCGWEGRVTPTKDCWAFTPAYRDYTNVAQHHPDQNYTGTRITYSLSGTVRDVTGAPMSGVVMTGLPCQEVTDVNGFYRCAVPCGWSGTVIPVMQDCSFTPPSRSYVNVHTSISDQDYIGECAPPGCDPGFEVAVASGGPGSYTGVRILANGMQSTPIGGLEFHLTYPTACLACSIVVSDYLSAPTVNCGSGEVHIIWEDFANPISVPDGHAIAAIIFEVLGQTGDTCEVCWLPGNEVVDPIGDPIAGLGYCCGSVIVEETTHSIEGNVVYYDMVREIPGVQVDLTGAAVAGTVSDAAGHYAFTNLASGNYVVTPSHGANDPGVSVADIIKIRRHLAVLEPFTSGYQLIAGDVTCDCNVSVSDIIKIRRYLAVLDTLPCGNWAFVDSSYHVSTTDWCPVPGDINTTLTSNQTDSSFVGVRKGDVNNTWSPSVAATAARQGDAHATAAEMTLTMNDVSATGETVTLPVILGHGTPVAGVELHLRFDPRYLAFAGLKSEVMNDVTISHDQSSVHLVWENLGQPIDQTAERVLTGIEFKLLNEPDEFTEVAITSAEVVDESGRPFVLLQQNGRVLASSGAASETLPGDFWLGQNYPNPFNPETDIAFYLPRQAMVTLAIYNMLGQQVTVLASGQLAAGEHTVHWDGRDASGRLVSSGVYLYRLNSSEFSEARKMLLLK